MLLRNYYNVMAFVTLGNNTDSTTFGEGHINRKYGTGGVAVINQSDNTVNRNHFIGLGHLASTATGIILGTGTTPVDYNDYKLAAKITSGITLGTRTIGTPVYDSENNRFTNTIGVMVTNTSAVDITITEVGITGQTNDTLLYREVLETPITIAAGTSSTITFNLSFDMPTIS